METTQTCCFLQILEATIYKTAVIRPHISHTQKISKTNKTCGTLLVWSYASHRAQCGVTTGHSTCCGYCVRDYHISFRLFALSNPSVPTLCLKDPWSGGWQKSFLLKPVCKTINNKQTRFAFLANRRKKNIERGRVTIRCS